MRKYFLRLSLFAISIVLAGAGCSVYGDRTGIEASGPAGMFLSTNKGDSWQSVSQLPTVEGVKDMSQVSVYRLFTDPQDNSALYWASRSRGFFFSYDNGQSWQRPGQNIFSGSFIYSLAVHPNDKCTIYVTDGSVVMKSVDCNRTWKEVYRESRDNTQIISLAFHNFEPYDVYIVETAGDVIRSVDEGLSWQVVSRIGAQLAKIESDPEKPGTMYIISRNKGLYRSDNRGVAWENLEDPLKAYSGALEYRRFLVQSGGDGETLLYWVSTYGILRSSDRGGSWTAYDLITPPGSGQIYGFAVNESNPNEVYYTATINNRSTFYRTEDGGKNWITKKLPSGQIPTVLYAHPEKEGWLYLGFTILAN